MWENPFSCGISTRYTSLGILNFDPREVENLFQEIRAVRSILWGQGLNKYPVEQIINNSSNIRIHTNNASSKESLIELALCVRPDLLVLDTTIPGNKSWYQLIGLLKSRISEMGIIAIVSDLEIPLIQDLAKSQVDGIIKSDRVHLELPHGIRAFQKKETFLNPQVARVLCSFLTNPAPTTANNNESSQDRGLLPTLTNRELEVLACLTRGMNYREISKHLFVSSSTVKTHVNNIFTKLNLNDRTQAVLYGLKHGIDQMLPSSFQEPSYENTGRRGTRLAKRIELISKEMDNMTSSASSGLEELESEEITV